MVDRIDISKYLPKNEIKAYLGVHADGSAEPEFTTHHFFLGDVPARLSEKLQINTGSNKKVQVLSFGKHPEIVSVTGYLLAYDAGGDWLRDMRESIENGYYNMQALVQANKHLRLYYSDRWLKGYILGFDYVETPNTDPLVGFRMEWLVMEVFTGIWHADVREGDTSTEFILTPAPEY